MIVYFAVLPIVPVASTCAKNSVAVVPLNVVLTVCVCPAGMSATTVCVAPLDNVTLTGVSVAVTVTLTVPGLSTRNLKNDALLTSQVRPLSDCDETTLPYAAS